MARASARGEGCLLRLVVISTGYNAPTKDKCLRSVARQKGTFEHVYIEAANQRPPREHFENLIEAIAPLDPWDIVCNLDGDDELAHDEVLWHVWEAYHSIDDLWLTYGQFMFGVDGKRGHCAPYQKGENLRTSPWRASHLRTFRAGLFKRIRPESLQRDGQWIPQCRDLVLMFPMIEMAGLERTLFIPEILVIYHEDRPFTERYDMADQRMWEAYIRSQPPYERIETFV
jgi:hypothetical protein